MEHPHFAIEPDPSHCMLRITLRGYWCVETVSAYRRAASKAAKALLAGGCPPRGLVSLVDARTLGPQSQEVIAAYQAAFSDVSAWVGRTALMTGSALFQLQAKRVGTAGQRIFTDETEALAWLLASVDA